MCSCYTMLALSIDLAVGHSCTYYVWHPQVFVDRCSEHFFKLSFWDAHKHENILKKYTCWTRFQASSSMLEVSSRLNIAEICMYVYMYVCMYVCAYVLAYVCMHVWIAYIIYIYIYIYIYILLVTAAEGPQS